MADDKAFTKANLLALRNCTLINMIDGCAISLPAHRQGEVPVGLMLAAPADRTGDIRTGRRYGKCHQELNWRSRSTPTAADAADLSVNQAVIAGWTGRDAVARDRHIAELEAIGIARPASTPIYYRVAARRLTTATSIEVSGPDSSGEVEFVLFGAGGRIFVGAGSDHTDRKVETYSVTVSKQMCDKPVSPVLWALDEVGDHWDQMSCVLSPGSMARACSIRKARSMRCCRCAS